MVHSKNVPIRTKSDSLNRTLKIGISKVEGGIGKHVSVCSAGINYEGVLERIEFLKLKNKGMNHGVEPMHQNPLTANKILHLM